jgi:hypothetical protein
MKRRPAPAPELHFAAKKLDLTFRSASFLLCIPERSSRDPVPIPIAWSVFAISLVVGTGTCSFRLSVPRRSGHTHPRADKRAQHRACRDPTQGDCQ